MPGERVGLTSSGLPTNLEHNFNRVPAMDKPRSTFDRSSAHKMTFDPNYLFPVYYDQVYPGDTMQVKGNLFGRILAPLKFPIMDNIYLDWFAFFVPERLLWEHFQASMGEQVNPGDPTDYLIPQVEANAWAVHSLGDYFQCIGAVYGSGGVAVNAMKFRAYNKIILDWFHDQNLVDSPPQNFDDGPDPSTDYALFNRRKRHDYFTSCLPFAQKGDPVQLPIGGTAPVIFPSSGSVPAGSTVTDETLVGGTNYPWGVTGATGVITADGYTAGASTAVGQTSTGFNVSMPGDAYANLAAAIGITINQMRLFITTQQFLEINARSGTRYIEQNLAHFGVVSPDARLQRSEFLGGGTIPINVHPVAQTSGTGIAGSTPQGQLAAFSTLSGNVSFTHSFVEHGYILVLAESRADLTYWQGIPHDMFERAQLDRYYPVFSNIGEQPILSREIYCDGSGGDADVFGYQEPWAHLRYKPSTIGGYFRPDVSGSLDFMHLSQDFSIRPVLNSTFISDAMPIDRVVTADVSPFFVLDSWFMNRSTRVLPVFSVPGLLRL